MENVEKKQDVTELINSFEDALKLSGSPAVPEFSDAPEELREYFKAQYMGTVLAKAYNEGEQVDWENGNQEKWLPWFRMSSGGFVFYITSYYCSPANAGSGSRLCFLKEKTAADAGRKFPEIYAKFLQG